MFVHFCWILRKRFLAPNGASTVGAHDEFPKAFESRIILVAQFFTLQLINRDPEQFLNNKMGFSLITQIYYHRPWLSLTTLLFQWTSSKARRIPSQWNVRRLGKTPLVNFSKHGNFWGHIFSHTKPPKMTKFQWWTSMDYIDRSSWIIMSFQSRLESGPQRRHMRKMLTNKTFSSTTGRHWKG